MTARLRPIDPSQDDQRFTLGTATAKFSVSVISERDRRRSNGVAYLWGVPGPAETHGMVQPPHSIKGDDAANDAAWRKFNAQEIANQRAFLMRALDLAGFKPTRVVWSRKAGCGCGCSPGFILRGFDLDISITVLKTEPAVQGVAA